MTLVLSGKISQRLESFGDLELWLLGEDAIKEFNQHIYEVYNDSFGKTRGESEVPMSEIEPAAHKNFPRGRICGVRHSTGKLVGTWGIIVRELDGTDAPLPTEEKYELNLKQVLADLGVPQIKYIFNGWRTAVNKEALTEFNIDRTQSIFIFDLLLRGLTQDFVGREDDFLGIADMEMIVYKYHRRVGIPWQKIGDGINFWNRDRFPFAFKLGAYRDYMRQHHPERAAFLFDKALGES
jgi:hypothetical protein